MTIIHSLKQTIDDADKQLELVQGRGHGWRPQGLDRRQSPGEEDSRDLSVETVLVRSRMDVTAGMLVSMTRIGANTRTSAST